MSIVCEQTHTLSLRGFGEEKAIAYAKHRFHTNEAYESWIVRDYERTETSAAAWISIAMI